MSSAEVYDPKAGTFSPTGSLLHPSRDADATVLADGRVLIVGGDSGHDFESGLFLASAELYEPKTGTFSATGSMATARDFPTATLLADGRVLVAGGLTSSGTLASAELYEPKTGTFTATGSMGTPRVFATATLLADGRVLIAGGLSSQLGNALASAEVYDPKTSTFTATGSMGTPRVFATATLLADGRVLVAGGDAGPGFSSGNYLRSAELYDPKTGTFSPPSS
jgi:hypothetical protein